jgi:hypothetical protein
VLAAFSVAPLARAAQWSPVALPELARGIPSSLSSVSCSSPRACLAVGGQTAERWNGGRWRLLPAPTRNGAALTAVSCTSPRACSAVGAIQRGHSMPLVKRWDGSSWHVQPSPDPARASLPGLGHDSVLNGIVCTSARSCLAVGQYGYASDHELGWGFAERWNGVHWFFSRVPRPPNALFSALDGISCRSARTCTAVGEYAIADAGGRSNMVALIERYDGARWSLQRSPAPVGAGSSLGAVSCTSSSACTAVGAVSSTTPGDEQPLVETWDGVAWAQRPLAVPAPAVGSRLLSVSCPAVRGCRAIGDYRSADPAAAIGPLTARSYRGSWNAQLLPAAAGIMTRSLLGVSCPRAGWCMAVGNDLAERYS